ncbi:MAG: hypothetical protein QNL70_10735, partial [Pseudomonas sp.]
SKQNIIHFALFVCRLFSDGRPSSESMGGILMPQTHNHTRFGMLESLFLCPGSRPSIESCKQLA